VNPLTIAVIAALSLWFPMTVLVQLPSKRCKGIRRYDPTGHLLPGWSFFAPKPAGADFAVWYRSWDFFDEDRDDVLPEAGAQWTELAGIEQRRITDALVNPGRYTRKSIFTCCNRIVIMLQHEGYGSDPGTGLPSDAMMISLPYLLLVTKVSALCDQAVAVQFRIDYIWHVSETPHPATVFRSAVHRVGASAEPGADSVDVVDVEAGGGGHVAAS
jgi:hypothetical protein